jgi:hypothetical protein
MADLYFDKEADNAPPFDEIPDVIRVDGVCYKRNYDAKEVPSEDDWDDIDQEWDNCLDCQRPTLEYKECCDDNDPQMLLTVSGNTSNITWCGETWTPAESGVTKFVCPNFYRKIKRKLTGTVNGSNTTAYSAEQYWVNINGDGLTLKRQYYIFRDYRFGSDWNWLIGTLIENKVRLPGYRDSVAYGFPNGITQRPIPKTQFYNIYPYFSVGVLSLGNPGTPTFDDAYLTDDFFGSFSNAGITYTWAKGDGWD